VKITLTRPACRIIKARNEAAEKLHRQTHNVGQGAVDMVNKGVIIFSDGVCPGFVSPYPACNMFCDLGIGQFSGVNDRRLGLDQPQIPRFADKGKTCDDLVGPAEKHPRNSFGVFRVSGFADDSAIKINNRICTDD
jgi:hypothetical protein